MLIYLDTMIVQYIADYYDYVYQDIASEHEVPIPGNEPKLATELAALRRLVFLEQFGHWDVAAPSHLMNELLAGKPTESQLDTYKILSKAWEDSLSWWNKGIEPDEEEVSSIAYLPACLNLRHREDRRHLAEAIALQASWFLTNDTEIIEKTREKQDELKNLTSDVVLLDPQLTTNQMIKRMLRITKVARPSDCVGTIDKYLSLR